ncbi:MAG: hypothetical protein ACI4MJ_07460 [Aristaeellaceae bacterium]
MKGCVIAMGGAGRQVLHALGCCALAGAVELPELELLLADTAPDVDKLTAWHRDYALLRTLWPEGRAIPAFRTGMRLRQWPGMLPKEAASLHALADTEDDRLLLQTLFPAETVQAEMPDSFRGRTDAAAVLLAGLTGSGNAGPSGALAEQLHALQEAAQAGETVRVALVGSAMGGMGAAGLTAMAALVRTHVPQAEVAAVVLLPYFRGEESQLASARAMLRQWAEDGLCATTYLLGLPQSAYLTAAEGHERARMPEWLAALCAVDFLREGRQGCYGWSVPYDHFGWDAFGAQERRMRSCFGGLMKAALAFRLDMGDIIRRGVTEPRLFRDKLIPWYARHFKAVRRMDDAQRTALSAQVEALSRLLRDYEDWLGAMMATLPPQLRAGSDMDAALRASEENYTQLMRLCAQLAVAQAEAERNGLATEQVVHRGEESRSHADEVQEALAQTRRSIEILRERQQACIRRTGGMAYLAMLRDMEGRCARDAAQFRGQTEEARRLVAQAEQRALPAERSGLATARTKLKRMEQSLATLEARLMQVRQDRAQAQQEGLNTLPPAEGLNEEPLESGLFSARSMGATDRKQLEETFPALVQGGDEEGYRAYKERIAAAPAEDEPLAGFLAAMLALQEGSAS